MEERGGAWEALVEAEWWRYGDERMRIRLGKWREKEYGLHLMGAEEE